MTFRRSPADLLRQTRALITLPRRWTQGVIARDRAGLPVLATDLDAYSFSVDGALLRIAELMQDWDAFDAASESLRRTCGGSVAAYNDHPEMLHVGALLTLDAAIARAEGGAP